MKKYEVKTALDDISEMSDAEIQANAEFIRKVALAAYALINNLNPKKSGN
jgi:hypothetical protein